ncbi:MAG TPA: ribosome silencing factor [Candidatus Omnitrophica bacterium]|nr:MAG: ribosome silencing factor [Omnitrophica WOR_2 bacterium GWA2_45_18]OGX21069.1 MAG: ribosome silencing factor [Omnitrophica WOR_2 bacterium GWC2_45_7]HBR13932.1 ribosome silencing factor [Candidatus Omnitrophota bacterium]
MFTSKDLAKKIAIFASDKKAEEISILDMRKVVNFCDYFVICSGNTDRHVRAIADHLKEELGKTGVQARFHEGLKKSDWVVFDTGDVIAHIFQKQAREFYKLEYLWHEAKAVNWQTS